MTISSTATNIGKSVKIRGEIVSTEDLVLDGDFEGTIKISEAVLTLGPDSRVRAEVHAQDIVVLGRLDGNIHAAGRVELRSGAMVQGDIHSGSLTIDQNVAFRGKVEPVPAPAAAQTFSHTPSFATQPAFNQQAVASPANPFAQPLPHVAERPAALPIRPAAASLPQAGPTTPMHSFGLGQSSLRTAVVPSRPGGGMIPGGGGPVSSGSHRISGHYPTALAAAAAAAASRHASAAEEEKEPDPSAALIFTERKA